MTQVGKRHTKAPMWAARSGWPVALLLVAGCVHGRVSPRAEGENRACVERLAAGDLDSAALHCSLGLQFDPDSPELLTNLGIIRRLQGRVAEAKDLFIRAIHHGQDCAQAYNNLGLLALAEGQLGVAESRLTAALRINPDFLNARLGLGMTYYRQGRRREAEEAFGLLVTSHPENVDGYAWLGYLALESKAYVDAVAKLNAATHLDPNHAPSWFNLGLAYAGLGKYAEAADAFHACLDADERRLECQRALGLMNGMKAATGTLPSDAIAGPQTP